MNLRSWLYLFARLLGDVSAVEHNRLPQRVARRLAGKITGRLLSCLFR